MYYETMEAVLAKSDKTIVETPGVVLSAAVQGAAPAAAARDYRDRPRYASRRFRSGGGQ